MKRTFVLLILLTLVSASRAFACFNPTDSFATEVVLNKPGASCDLGQIRLASNVSFQEGVFIYRSHFNKLAAVMLEELNESEPAEILKGLSVRIQIPTKTVMITRVSAIVRLELENVAVGAPDEDFLRSLGYEVEVLEAGDVRPGILSIYLRKGNISLSVNQYEVEGRNRVEFRAEIGDSDTFSDELQAEFKKIIASLGLDETVLDRVNPEVVKIELEDLVEAVDISKDEFDFKSAMKVELDWLTTNDIIKGIDDGDVAEISGISEAGLAGWNARIIHERGKWLPYNETDNPMLFRDVDCGGFSLDRMAYDETIILPGSSSVSFQGKLPTKWGEMKVGQ